MILQGSTYVQINMNLNLVKDSKEIVIAHQNSYPKERELAKEYRSLRIVPSVSDATGILSLSSHLILYRLSFCFCHKNSRLIPIPSSQDPNPISNIGPGRELGGLEVSFFSFF